MCEWQYNDPRPEIKQDSWAWNRILKLVVELENKQVASAIQKDLWTIRSVGTMLKPVKDGGLKFVPIFGEGGGWESEAEFEDMKRRYLGPYAKEISFLLGKVMNP
jgi:hypothetical protein